MEKNTEEHEEIYWHIKKRNFSTGLALVVITSLLSIMLYNISIVDGIHLPLWFTPLIVFAVGIAIVSIDRVGFD